MQDITPSSNQGLLQIFRDTCDRYSALHTKIAELLRDPTLPERQIALLIALDEQTTQAVDLLKQLLDAGDLSAVGPNLLSFAQVAATEIDTFEDNLPIFLAES